MNKRKRVDTDLNGIHAHGKITKLDNSKPTIHLQIVVGSYERVLHGITATIPRESVESSTDQEDGLAASFADAFLFQAHTSAIKCLALSPAPPASASSQKVILATGGSDEKINLFHLSTRSPRGPALPSLSSRSQEDPDNRSLGSLHTHDSSITALHFPNRSKLLSSCGNNVIGITSTRDFHTLSIIKAPNPKHANRPSGDTSTATTLPCGINDFAVHPSMKLMISVGRAERCMRLWNLVSGKKAGVLNFDRQMLQEIGEDANRWTMGEATKISWNSQGTEFAVGFQRGVCIFGIDCQARAKAIVSPASIIHQMRYIPGLDVNVLAVSTEDSRILFLHTSDLRLNSNGTTAESVETAQTIPSCQIIGQISGESVGIAGRIKDFQVLPLTEEESSHPTLLVTAAGSNGMIGLWSVRVEQLITTADKNGSGHKSNGSQSKSYVPKIGRWFGSYKTNSRITCLAAFVLRGSGADKTESHPAQDREDSESASPLSEDGEFGSSEDAFSGSK